MSSILLSASPWNGCSTRKRIPTTNRKKTIKQMPAEDDYEPVEDAGHLETSDVSENFESTIGEQETRNSRVNQLLNKITDSGGGLADFVPVASNRDSQSLAKKSTLADLLPTSETETPMFKPEFAPNNLGEDRMSNYAKSYEHTNSGILGKPYYASMGIGGGAASGSDPVLQKLNYITHILEDIQMEKTSNITEELILYSFLGVFIIFVVDSFSKAGKYYR
jgi:hypothetical protein